ncbi:MAG: hypothetical protein ACYS9X_12730 [Planctomycetota bacterium]
MSGTRQMDVCPKCGADIPRRRSERPRYSRLALALFVVAALVTLPWIGFLVAWSPAFLRPTGTKGFLVCAIVYLAPGLVVGAVSASRPRVLVLRCPSCGWRGAKSFAA